MNGRDYFYGRDLPWRSPSIDRPQADFLAVVELAGALVLGMANIHSNADIKQQSNNEYDITKNGRHSYTTSPCMSKQKMDSTP